MIEEENKSRQTTLIYFATQTVSEVDTLKSLIEKSPDKDNDDLKSSANRFETLMQICEKILTDTENQFYGYISFLRRSEDETILSLKKITIRNPDKDNDDYKSLANRIKTLNSERTATIDKIEKLQDWRSILADVIDVVNEKPLLEWIDFDPEIVLEMLSSLKISCQNYKTQT